MAIRKVLEYHTPPDTRCPECGELCQIIGLNNAFDYAGSHCTHGLPGTHYPNDWGEPISSCCCAPIEPDYDEEDYESSF